jgi:hypothetical protein
MRPVVISCVERGWRAARERALMVPAEEAAVVHLVKGWVSPSVAALAGMTHPIRLIGVPHVLFWPVVWGVVHLLAACGMLRGMWVDNDRSARRIGRWMPSAAAGMVLVQDATPAA